MEKVYDILLIYTFSPFLQIFFISPIQILILIGTHCTDIYETKLLLSSINIISHKDK